MTPIYSLRAFSLFSSSVLIFFLFQKAQIFFTGVWFGLVIVSCECVHAFYWLSLFLSAWFILFNCMVISFRTLCCWVKDMMTKNEIIYYKAIMMKRHSKFDISFIPSLCHHITAALLLCCSRFTTSINNDTPIVYICLSVSAFVTENDVEEEKREKEMIIIVLAEPSCCFLSLAKCMYVCYIMCNIIRQRKWESEQFWCKSSQFLVASLFALLLYYGVLYFVCVALLCDTTTEKFLVTRMTTTRENGSEFGHLRRTKRHWQGEREQKWNLMLDWKDLWTFSFD